MQVSAWQIASWDKVGFSVEHWGQIAETMQCFGSTIIENDGLLSGQTVWGAQTDEIDFGLGWDWREVYPGVVAMADPMTVLSNVVLLEAGEPISASEQIIHMNNTIYALPWQISTRQPSDSFSSRVHLSAASQLHSDRL